MRRILRPLAVPLGVIAILLLLIVPVPPWLLDVAIILNIVLALLILLTTMFVKRPRDFSVFPSLLLVATLFRLGLNVAATRLVLSQGYAGAVISTFGHFAIAGSLIIGAVIFLILVVIQFVVVTRGAERVAEVGARFTLDAMPGKQMAIDADLNAGLITEEQARKRRAEVAAEADFYGAMDGASKFVKGDAIAGIIIIVVNVVGGIAVGMVQDGLDIMAAIEKYTTLTIGDGLTAQIPALLLSVATGMIVTRATEETDMGSSASRQLTQSRMALMIAGGAAIALGLIPGMPIIPFLVVGAILLIVGQRLRSRPSAEEQAAQEEADAATPPPDSPEDLMERMRVHALEIQLAPDLVDLVGGPGEDDLLARVKALRRRVAMELGLVVPPVRTRDNVELPLSSYSIRVAGVEAGAGIAPAGTILALGEGLDALPGTATIDPVFGIPAKWIPAGMRHVAELAGASVIDRASVIVTHLNSVVLANAARLLSREDVRMLTDGVKRQSPAAADELIPAVLSLGEVQRVLQGLLTEGVPINDLVRIYEALALRGKVSLDPDGLIEAARAALGPVVASRRVRDGVLRVVMIDPVLEQAMLESLRPSEQGAQLVLDPADLDAVLASLTQGLATANELGADACLVCAPAIRPAVRRLVASQGIGSDALPVFSYAEASAVNAAIETIGVIRGRDSIAA